MSNEYDFHGIYAIRTLLIGFYHINHNKYGLSIDNLRKSNEFYEALYRALTDIQGNSWDIPKELVDKIEDITSYEQFQQYLQLKADDGSKFFRGYNNKFVVPIYTKFPNIAKSDTASLYIYKFDFESDLVVWKVFKKKLNRDVYTIFRVMSFLPQ